VRVCGRYLQLGLPLRQPIVCMRTGGVVVLSGDDLQQRRVLRRSDEDLHEVGRGLHRGQHRLLRDRRRRGGIVPGVRGDRRAVLCDAGDRVREQRMLRFDHRPLRHAGQGMRDGVHGVRRRGDDLVLPGLRNLRCPVLRRLRLRGRWRHLHVYRDRVHLFGVKPRLGLCCIVER